MSEQIVLADMDLNEVKEESNIEKNIVISRLIRYFKNMFCISNIGAWGYIVFNYYLAVYIIGSIVNTQLAFKVITISYISVMLLSATKLGDIVLRFFKKVSELNNSEGANRINEIFEEVKGKAKANGFEIDEDIKLLVCQNIDKPVKAIGRKTILVSDYVLKLTDDKCRVMMARELAFIYNNTINITLMVKIADFVFMCAHYVYRFLAFIMGYLIIAIVPGGNNRRDPDDVFASMFGITAGFGLGYLFSELTKKIYGFLLKIKCAVTNKAFKEGEYKADVFAIKIGYLGELEGLLGTGDRRKRTAFSKEPTFGERLERISELDILN